MNIDEDVEQRINWINKRVALSDMQREYIKFQLKDATKNTLNVNQLIAWENYKKVNWWNSDAIDVEKVLMEQFICFYHEMNTI